MDCQCGSASFRSGSARHQEQGQALELSFDQCSGCGRVTGEQLRQGERLLRQGEQARMAFQRFKQYGQWPDTSTPASDATATQQLAQVTPKGVAGDARGDREATQKRSENEDGVAGGATATPQGDMEEPEDTTTDRGDGVAGDATAGAENTTNASGTTEQQLESQLKELTRKSIWHPYKYVYAGERRLKVLVIRTPDGQSIKAVPSLGIECRGEDAVEVACEGSRRIREALGLHEPPSITCAPPFEWSWCTTAQTSPDQDPVGEHTQRQCQVDTGACEHDTAIGQSVAGTDNKPSKRLTDEDQLDLFA